MLRNILIVLGIVALLSLAGNITGAEALGR